MVSLLELISRLQADVPPADGIPTLDQYERAVRDAVTDVSRRAPLTRETTINVISGQASYTLPGDFLRIISLPSLNTPGGIAVTSAGLVPFATGFRDSWTVAGQTITFQPTPAYTLARRMRYAAAYVLDVTGTYADLSENVAAIALLKAQTTVWGLFAARELTRPGGDVKRYTQGEVTIERVTSQDQAKLYQNRASEAASAYQSALNTHIGIVGMRG